MNPRMMSLAEKLLPLPAAIALNGPPRGNGRGQDMRERIDFSQITFLVADRDPLSAALIRDILRSLGAIAVHRASDSEAAQKLLRQGDVDILIAEWDIGPMTGLELVHWVRNTSYSPNTMLPIIMITAHSDTEFVSAARDHGVTEFLAKPFNAERLYQRLVSVIARPREFVRNEDFFGPDRRRRKVKPKGGERREFGR